MAELHWFPAWLTDHLARHPHEGLPEPDEPDAPAFYEAWKDAFAKRRISIDGATAASKELVANPPRFKREHFPALLGFAVDATRQALEAATGRTHHDLSTREGAEHASRGCKRCGGGGLAMVEHIEPAYCAAAKCPSLVSAYCVCAYGRWIKQNHAEKAKDVFSRMPDLNDAIQGRGQWRVHASSELDGEVPTMSVRQMVEGLGNGRAAEPKHDPRPAAQEVVRRAYRAREEAAAF